MIQFFQTLWSLGKINSSYSPWFENLPKALREHHRHRPRKVSFFVSSNSMGTSVQPTMIEFDSLGQSYTECHQVSHMFTQSCDLIPLGDDTIWGMVKPLHSEWVYDWLYQKETCEGHYAQWRTEKFSKNQLFQGTTVFVWGNIYRKPCLLTTKYRSFR